MTQDQGIFLAILVATITLFIWGRWRHDMVAVAALLACVSFGLVDRDAAFEGFGHPAVVTVACVLILSRALQVSGAGGRHRASVSFHPTPVLSSPSPR